MRGLAHIGYVVREIEPALKRFLAEGAQVVVAPVLDPIQNVWVSLVQQGDELPLELVAPAAETNHPLHARLSRGGGLDHFCYYVDSLEEALAAETEQRALVVCPPCYAVAFRRRIAFVQRRSGLVVEFMTYGEEVLDGT